MEKINEILDNIITVYGPRLIGGIVVLIAGLWLIKILVKSLVKIMNKTETDKTLIPFIKSLTGITLKVLLFISVLSILKVEMTSFIAIVGAAGLAVGMALSGTLQNFAGGVMILLFKPFQKGDYIEAQGHSGTVFEIQIFNTILKTPDNKTIIIPNGGLSTSSMVNYSTESERRVDWQFGIAYGDDITKAREIIQELLDADKRIHDTPPSFIAVSELADSSVNFVVRAWVNSADYWPVFFEMNEKIYNTFNQKGINIPFPQMDVHVHQN
jgi:small conductance mechanosensitive channel